MLRSITAVLAGLIFIILTHTGTDALLAANGILPAPGQPADTGQLLLASTYRSIYAILGYCLTAWLAPRHPMRHALILGGIGLLLSTAGAIAMWDHGPAWYPLSLIGLSLPSAWLGGYLVERARARRAG